MKKIIYVIIIICSLLMMNACKKHNYDLPDNPIVFKTGTLEVDNEDTGYQTVEYEGKKYIFFGSIKPKGLLNDFNYAFGHCIGYIENDKNERIFMLKDESSDIWLIEYYTNGIMENPVVLREINSKGSSEIPSFIQSFGYDYWN